MKTLLVYFSRKGLVKRLVNDYEFKPDTDILELEPVKSYKGPIGYIRGRLDSLNNKIPEIKQCSCDLKNYDRVMIVGGVWSTNICGPILAFMKQNKGKFKNVEYIAIAKRRIVSFEDIFSAMDYCGNTHYKRATAITVKFNRLTSIKRY